MNRPCLIIAALEACVILHNFIFRNRSLAVFSPDAEFFDQLHSHIHVEPVTLLPSFPFSHAFIRITFQVPTAQFKAHERSYWRLAGTLSVQLLDQRLLELAMS
jgi:hypothetical protein